MRNHIDFLRVRTEMGSSKRDRGGTSRLQCLSGSMKTQSLLVCLENGRKESWGSGLKVRKDTGEQLRDGEDSSYRSQKYS